MTLALSLTRNRSRGGGEGVYLLLITRGREALSQECERPGHHGSRVRTARGEIDGAVTVFGEDGAAGC